VKALKILYWIVRSGYCAVKHRSRMIIVKDFRTGIDESKRGDYVYCEGCSIIVTELLGHHHAHM
jgi:hypothetical protein